MSSNPISIICLRIKDGVLYLVTSGDATDFQLYTIEIDWKLENPQTNPPKGLHFQPSMYINNVNLVKQPLRTTDSSLDTEHDAMSGSNNDDLRMPPVAHLHLLPVAPDISSHATQSLSLLAIYPYSPDFRTLDTNSISHTSSFSRIIIWHIQSTASSLHPALSQIATMKDRLDVSVLLTLTKCPNYMLTHRVKELVQSDKSERTIFGIDVWGCYFCCAATG